MQYDMHSVLPNVEPEKSEACQTIGNLVANEEGTFDGIGSPEFNYKEHYKEMKRKLRLLIYVSSSTIPRS